jgi:flagellar biosynthesis/type III secretory pathway protein FliH
MNFVVKFTESDEIFKSSFGEVNAVSNGGFERGYAQGLEEGEQKGYTKGYAEGESKGFEQGYEQGNTPMYYARGFSYTYSKVVFPENFELVLRVKEISGELYQTFYQAKNLKSFCG